MARSALVGGGAAAVRTLAISTRGPPGSKMSNPGEEPLEEGEVVDEALRASAKAGTTAGSVSTATPETAAAPGELSVKPAGPERSPAEEEFAKKGFVQQNAAQSLPAAGQVLSASPTLGGVAPAAGTSGAPVLPPGWKQHWSKTKQRFYYLFSPTGETTWDIPSKSKLSFGDAAAVPASGRRGGEDVVMKELGVALKSHSEVEGRIIAQLEAAAKQREEEKDQADIGRFQGRIQQLNSNVDAIKKKLASPAYSSSFQQAALKEQLKELEDKLVDVHDNLKQTKLRLAAANDEVAGDNPDAAVRIVAGAGSQETERDRMIRMGLITPFDGRAQMERARLSTNSNGAAAAHTPNSNGKRSAASSSAHHASRNLPPPPTPKSTRVTKVDPARQRIAEKSRVVTSRQRRRHGTDDIVDDGDALAFQARMNEQTRARLEKKRKKEGKRALR